MSSNLKQRLIRLGNQKPSLREHLRPILDTLTANRDAGRTDRRTIPVKREQEIREDPFLKDPRIFLLDHDYRQVEKNRDSSVFESPWGQDIVLIRVGYDTRLKVKVDGEVVAEETLGSGSEMSDQIDRLVNQHRKASK